MRIVLSHLSGHDKGRKDVFPLGSISIGRDSACDLHFDEHQDLEVSGRHCVIEYENSIATIRDLESTNGTWINGAEIKKHTLKSGDKIELGAGGPGLRFEIIRGLKSMFFGLLYSKGKTSV